jgi:hypothetical protein
MRINTQRNQNLFYTELEKHIQDNKAENSLKGFGEKLINSLADLSYSSYKHREPFEALNHLDNILTVKIKKDSFHFSNIEKPTRLFRDDKDFCTTLSLEMLRNDDLKPYLWIDEWQSCERIALTFSFFRSEDSIANDKNLKDAISMDLDTPEDSFYSLNAVISTFEDRYNIFMESEKQYESQKTMAIDDFEDNLDNTGTDSHFAYYHLSKDLEEISTVLFDAIEKIAIAIYHSRTDLRAIWIL